MVQGSEVKPRESESHELASPSPASPAEESYPLCSRLHEGLSQDVDMGQREDAMDTGHDIALSSPDSGEISDLTDDEQF